MQSYMHFFDLQSNTIFAYELGVRTQYLVVFDWIVSIYLNTSSNVSFEWYCVIHALDIIYVT